MLNPYVASTTAMMLLEACFVHFQVHRETLIINDKLIVKNRCSKYLSPLDTIFI